MKGKILISILVGSLLILSSTAHAQKARKHAVKERRNAAVHHKTKRKAAVRKIKRYNRKSVVVVRPRKVRTIASIHKTAIRINYNTRDYHFYAGRFYRGKQGAYLMILPPRGLRIRALPAKAHRFMWLKRNYFYHSGVYYVKEGDEYEVTDAEEGMIVPDLPEDLIEEVKIDGSTFYSAEGTLYKKHSEGYQVVGLLEN